MHGRRFRFTGTMKGFTLIELLVVVAIIAVLISILMPAMSEARCQAKRTKCGANLHSITQAMATCWAENRGYGPGWDDGGLSFVTNMLTWTDVLFDEGYLANVEAAFCPDDMRPDDIARTRGVAWGFSFVDKFGVGEQIKPGVRTSYALNAQLHWNNQRDKFDDAGRQSMAMDGWWTWYGSMNAQWLMGSLYMGITTDPLNTPNWQGTMIGWRHCKTFAANTAYVDGHVAVLFPKRPYSIGDLRDRTVDTVDSFTWLPGEKGGRFDFDPYRGEVLGWRAPVPRVPAWTRYNTKILKFSDGREQAVPQDYPEELNPNWRTDNDAWRELPNENQDRR